MPEHSTSDALGAESGREFRQISGAVFVCFLVSGAVGLIYEVLWIRMLGLVFGHTVFAITTVLASFMGGLGLGSYWFGRIADRQRRLLTFYGILEIGIGVYCLCLPALLGWVRVLYLWISRAWSPSYVTFSVLQFMLVTALLVVPTTLMGATLPVLTRFFVREDRTLGRRVGMLYAINTFGAVLGALLAGYWLVPTLGIQTTLRLAVVMNVGLGTLVIVFDRHLWQLTGTESPSARWVAATVGTPGSAPLRMSAVWMVSAAFAASGAASMIYEVSWTRALTLVIGSSTYAFTGMLVAFLAGISIGSWVFATCLGRRTISPAVFASLQLGIGVSGLIVLAAFGHLPVLFLEWFQISQASWFVELLQFGMSLVVMLMPTLLIGMTFPCAIRILSRGLEHVGNDTGWIYAVNTAGAILGTIFAGFVGIPLWGIQWTMRIGVGINLCIAAALFVISPRTSSRVARLGFSAAALVAMIAAGWLAPWDPALMTSGVAIYGHRFLPMLRAGAIEGQGWRPEVVYYKDGISATVSVHREGPRVSLRVNGKTDASNSGDMHTQLFSGHIPLLLHPHPKRVLIIGLGSGVTVGAVAQYPVDRIDVIEIEPAVVDASRFFEKENRKALNDPRVHMIIADGRNFLLNTEVAAYDVIISEPSNPWIRGLATLFSQEFYALARSRLARDGIMLQWVQGYGIAPDDFRMVVATFRSAFPKSTLWTTQVGDNFLVGVQDALIPLGRIQQVFAASSALREDFARVGIGSPFGLLADFLLGPADLARFAGHEALNTDDTLWLEFSAPRTLYDIGYADANHQMLRSSRSADVPLSPTDMDRLQTAEGRSRLALGYLGKGFLAEAETEFAAAARLDPACIPCQLEQAGLLIQRGMALRAMDLIGAVLEKNPRNPEAYLLQGRAFSQQGLPEKAIAALDRATALAPTNGEARLRLAMAYRDRLAFERSLAAFDAARRLRPADPAVLIPAAETLLASGRAAEVASWLQPLTANMAEQLIPTRAKLLQLQGMAYLQLRQTDRAFSALSQAVRMDPVNLGIRLALSQVHEARGELVQAAAVVEKGLQIYPNDVQAFQRLQFLLAKLGAASS